MAPTPEPEKPSDDYSMSAYNPTSYFKQKEGENKLKPEVIAEHIRSQHLLELNPVFETAQEDLQSPQEALPVFKSTAPLPSQCPASHHRISQTQEVQLIKEILARDNCSQQIKAIETAVVMPQFQQFDLQHRKYPAAGSMLMQNPFPQKKKKSKKKSKK